MTATLAVAFLVGSPGAASASEDPGAAVERRAAAPCPQPLPPAVPPSPHRRTPSPGAAGVGDPYFEGAGNGGYDIAHYDVALAYASTRTGSVDATVTATATAVQDLSAFDLDFRGPPVASVAVDGREARHRRAGRELVITPAEPIRAGRTFRVAVAKMFGFSVYVRGAMTLQALRDRVGDKAFFTILRTWTAEHRHSTATTPQFTALAERVSGQRLTTLFETWLRSETKPLSW